MTSFLTWSCEIEEVQSPEYEDLGTLEVSFVYDDTTVKSIRLTPASQTIEVEARLNFENIKWNVVSDQEWCVVEKDLIHEGSGTFTITVDVNKGFDEKEAAVVSLCAGDYKANLRVTQDGNVFIMDQVFGLGMKKAGSAEVCVKTVKGVNWETRQPEWMHIDKVEVSSENGETEYKMIVQWDENTSASRLGAVGLYKEGDKTPSVQYALWQFGEGPEYDFEADDNIRIFSKPTESIPLEIRTPAEHIDSLKHPEWVRLEKVENDDNTISWLLYFPSNPSDCFSYRETQLTYTTMGTSEEHLLPLIYQNYYSVGGLISAKGFTMFAERFNSGGDISEWVKDGVINVRGDVDMSKLEGEWVSIGTKERPFDLKFNGGGKQISGFSASNPLLGICDGAEIYNVVLDNTCKVSFANEFESDSLYLSALAKTLNNSLLKDCSCAATVELDATALNNAAAVYVGGLVVNVGPNASVIGSQNLGTMNVKLKRTASNGEIFIGGIAAYVEGSIEDCENAGTVSDNSNSKFHYVGGVTAYEGKEAELVNCTNSGVVTHASTRTVDKITEMNRDVYLGGLVGRSYGVLDNLVNNGTAELNTNAKTIYLGGVSGRVEDGSMKKCYSTSGVVSYNAPLNTENKPANLGRYVYVGGLVGSLNINLELDCSDMPVACNLNSTGTDGNGNLLLGGLIGVAKKNLKLTSPKWTGAIKFNMPDGTTEKNDVCIGGVVGSSDLAETVITGAETSGSIKVFAVRTSYWKVPTAIGGVLGCASTGCSVTKSTNNASLEWDATTKSSSKGGVVSTGGIIGRVNKGLVTISECTNNGLVHNVLWHDAKWTSGYLLASRAGGIIGTYGYVKKSDQYDMDFSAFNPEDSNRITITDCHTTSEVLGYRGLVGGVAGYLYNATVTNCSYTGVSSNKRSNCNVGGIAGAVENTTINDCIVKAPLYGVAAGSCEFKAGGIAAYLYTNSTISNCSYFGQITTGDNKTNVAYCGGIVGEAQSGCSITGCKFGGSLPNENNYKESVTITMGNYADYIVGNDAVTATGCSYWNGE